jgi:hypothetical protein
MNGHHHFMEFVKNLTSSNSVLPHGTTAGASGTTTKERRRPLCCDAAVLPAVTCRFLGPVRN